MSVTYKTDAPEFLREYLDYIAVIKGRSTNTTANYYEDLKLYLRFMKQKYGLTPENQPFEEIRIGDVTEELIRKSTLLDVMDFLYYGKAERGNGAKSRGRRASALRQFYKYLTNNKAWWPKSPLENLELPKAGQTLPKYLNLEQSRKLLDTVTHADTDDVSRNKFMARDNCILTFFLNCGFRLSELAGINVTDIRSDDEGGGKFLKITGKGSKERIVYLNPACVLAYERYLAEREAHLAQKERKETALFISRNYTRLTPRAIENIVNKHVAEIGLSGQGFSAHKLRHTAATLMYRNGVDVRTLKDVLGHENLNTTQIYTHVADEQIRRAFLDNPLNDTEKVK